MKKVSIIIVTWNSEDVIVQCLQALHGRQADIVVIDNNSSDHTRDVIKNIFPNVPLVANTRNIKLSPALNQGIHFFRSDYYFILNPDVIVGEDTIESLTSYLSYHPDAGIVGPKLLNPDKTIQYSCRAFPTLRTILTRGIGFEGSGFSVPYFMRQYLMIDYDHKRPREVDWVLGAAMMIRKECTDDLSGFDEKYPIYYGDVDFCWRAKKHGWKVVYNPEAIATHHYQRSSARGGMFNPLKWSHARSALRFLIRKNFL